jgi:competence protein ComGF
MSIALFVVLGVYSKYSCIILGTKSEQDCSTFALIYNLIGMITVSSLALASIILLAMNLGNFSNIDIEGTMAFVK